MIPYHEAIENSHVVAGLITNCLLIYVVAKFSKKSLGVYKEMLLFFAAYDVFLVTLHGVVKQKVIVVETTIFGATSESNNRLVTALYASCSTIPFVLMIIDFLYRYWCIARPDLIPLFKNWKFISFLVITPLAEFAICLSIAITLCYLCYYNIYVLSGHTISAYALSVQRKLFVSLCAQTAVPMLFVYIPYFCVVTLPFLKLPVFFWDDACMLLTTCFPAWDGILVILLMPDYWRGLTGKVWKSMKTTPKQFSLTTMVTVTQTR